MPGGIRADQIRDGFLGTQGFRILRFWNSDIDQNLDGVMERILETLNSSGSVFSDEVKVGASAAAHPHPTRLRSFGASPGHPPHKGEG